jgi:hypothetical protein
MNKIDYEYPYDLSLIPQVGALIDLELIVAHHAVIPAPDTIEGTNQICISIKNKAESTYFGTPPYDLMINPKIPNKVWVCNYVDTPSHHCSSYAGNRKSVSFSVLGNYENDLVTDPLKLTIINMILDFNDGEFAKWDKNPVEKITQTFSGTTVYNRIVEHNEIAQAGYPTACCGQNLRAFIREVREMTIDQLRVESARLYAIVFPVTETIASVSTPPINQAPSEEVVNLNNRVNELLTDNERLLNDSLELGKARQELDLANLKLKNAEEDKGLLQQALADTTKLKDEAISNSLENAMLTYTSNSELPQHIRLQNFVKNHAQEMMVANSDHCLELKNEVAEQKIVIDSLTKQLEDEKAITAKGNTVESGVQGTLQYGSFAQVVGNSVTAYLISSHPEIGTQMSASIGMFAGTLTNGVLATIFQASRNISAYINNKKL